MVDAGKLEQLVSDLTGPVYYIVGSPAMVEAMQWELAEADVASDKVRTEGFYGYQSPLA